MAERCGIKINNSYTITRFYVSQTVTMIINDRVKKAIAHFPLTLRITIFQGFQQAKRVAARAGLVEYEPENVVKGKRQGVYVTSDYRSVSGFFTYLTSHCFRYPGSVEGMHLFNDILRFCTYTVVVYIRVFVS